MIEDDWLTFWDSPHFIYVNARHKDAHYRLIATQIAALVPRADARVLDYGCGEAQYANMVADAAGELLLCEGAPSVRAELQKKFAANPKIRVLAPHEVAGLPERCLDLVVLHSVLQYLTAAGAGALFALFHRALKPDGLLVVGDVIEPQTAAVTDATALLHFARANGFLLAAIWGLVRTLLSDYWRLRSHLGLTRYTHDAIIEKLSGAGFVAQSAPANLGHNQKRRTYYARPR